MAPTSEKPTPNADKRFVCDDCGYSSNIKSRLVDHVNGVHLGLKGSTQSEDNDDININNEPSGSGSESGSGSGNPSEGDKYAEWYSQCEYACRECATVYRQPAALKNHIVIRHNMDLSSYKLKHNTATLMTKEVRG